MTLEEILKIADIGQRIELLKLGRGKYPYPATTENWNDWHTEGHEIFDEKKYKDQQVLIEKGKKIYSETLHRTVQLDDKTDTQKINRIGFPLEQDIVNIHTSFTVGKEPKMDCTPEGDDEERLLKALNFTLRKNKIKYQNKKEVRAWFSEQEVAEYWWAAPDTDGFWQKIWKGIKSIATGKTPSARLKSAIWSPFLGDHLYPYFENDDMKAFMREYKIKNPDDSETQCYMVIDSTMVYTWKLIGGTWQEVKFKHGFSKMPIIWMYRHKPLCRKIKTLRVRLEKLMSQYADCIDYHFFPYLLLWGEVEKLQGKEKNRVINMMGTDAKAQYLTWDQVPDTIKFEAETLIQQIYDLTDTPRITFDNLKSLNSPSGTAFQYYFLGAQLAVENHAEEVGPFMQRRVNFLVSALGDMNSQLYKASQTIDIDVDLVPYAIDDIASKVSTAVQATGGPVWDKKTGIVYVGNIDSANDVYEQLMKEQKESNSQKNEAKTPQPVNTPIIQKEQNKEQN
jgi:hypothetical protein